MAKHEERGERYPGRLGVQTAGSRVSRFFRKKTPRDRILDTDLVFHPIYGEVITPPPAAGKVDPP
jgi:hypothetical protein